MACASMMMCSDSGCAQRTAEDACRLRSCAAAAIRLCAGAGWQFVDAGGSCREQAPAAPVRLGSRDLGVPRTSALLSGCQDRGAARAVIAVQIGGEAAPR
jgi:hypothetical protein